MKKYKILIALSALLLTASCTESFFNLEPSDKVSTDKVYKTANDFNIAVIGCYAKLQEHFSFYYECSEYRSDNMQLTAPTTGTQDRYDIDQFQEKASNSILSDSWGIFNNGVYRCNLVLDQIDSANFDETLKAQYKAEALFLHALNYFNMYRTWGGVPTTRTVVSVEEALKIKRSTDQEMYELITGDLEEIITHTMLPASYTGNDIGRATLGAAKTLLGKVYLTFHRWEEARDILAQVIGTYSLLENPADIFDVEKKMNSEIIFAIRFNKTVVGEGHGNWYSTSSANFTDYPTPELVAAYDDPADLRRDLISFVQEGNTYQIKKYYDTLDPSTERTGNDFILLRYADVLLMYAEALNEIAYSNSQNSEALNALNAVHTRAGLAPIEITSLPNKDAFRKAILKERQCEFPFEGHRWFDLVRMGYAKEVMLAQDTPSTTTSWFTPFHRQNSKRSKTPPSSGRMKVINPTKKQ
ncbi:MAG: RagB/SusD family nutrient uptake outer membrane protein [Bacteroides sp.]|nr:RagB/SusD family nutrient uptake outer membrane protein [Bacteroides sp.]